MIKHIICPFCGSETAQMTYEEDRVYKLHCTDCWNDILHEDTSWDHAEKFFKGIRIKGQGV